MSDRAVTTDDVAVPRFLYGTAWKEDETQRLVELALREGFRGIDTANQRRHYHEAAVGQALAAAIASSLVTREQLQALCAKARVRPRFVQNRCYAVRGWDRDVRAFCAANGVTYQGFSLLTANRQVLAHPAVSEIATRHGRTPAQVVFRFAL